jgi:probable phosphoglycerate mutase
LSSSGIFDESLHKEFSARADRFIAKVRARADNVLAFASGHIIRIIAARWLNLPPASGRCFFLSPRA